MVVQLAAAPGDWRHWGAVFWRMCLVTSTVALYLAVTFTSRGWCRICPVGTVAAATGGVRQPLQVAAHCRACGHCEKVCPMHLDIAVHRAAGVLPHRDCVKCSTCVKACPKQALSWPV
jgi:polyferredoxin